MAMVDTAQTYTSTLSRIVDFSDVVKPGLTRSFGTAGSVLVMSHFHHNRPTKGGGSCVVTGQNFVTPVDSAVINGLAFIGDFAT